MSWEMWGRRSIIFKTFRSFVPRPSAKGSKKVKILVLELEEVVVLGLGSRNFYFFNDDVKNF
jgi:hypothetical protein